MLSLAINCVFLQDVVHMPMTLLPINGDPAICFLLCWRGGGLNQHVTNPMGDEESLYAVFKLSKPEGPPFPFALLMGW